MRLAFGLTGAALTICLVLAALHDYRREWRPTQAAFKRLALERADTEAQRQAVERMALGIQQIFLPSLGRTDRCTTCHLGIENPTMAGAPQPHASHPGALLRAHPPAKFGCTICHQGQGLATSADAAHAREIKHWEEPMLSGALVEASCERCHRDVEVAGAARLNEGRRLFAAKGCRGCHKVYGKGGVLGAELTDLGRASIYLKHPLEQNMAALAAPSGGDLNVGYIMESIAWPAAQPATTTMPDYGMAPWQVDALATYVKGLTAVDVPSAYRPEAVFRAEPASGRELYVAYCSACHGQHGEGGYKIGRMGTALHNDDFLALASVPFLRGVIEHGRNSANKIMPAWRKDVGGLDADEIDRIVAYLQSWKAAPPALAEVLASSGSVEVGEGLYRRNCADCHGSYREGKIGPSLQAPEFLAVASTRFLYQTLAQGRPGTAMPAWNTLDAGQLRSLLLFLEQPVTPPAAMAAVSARGDVELGRRLYRSSCATCHGSDAGGGIGPSLSSPELAALADDAFYVRTLVQGRKDAGMPAWDRLRASDLSALIAYLRQLARPAQLVAVPQGRGDARAGGRTYAQVCAGCHGGNGEGGTGPALASAELLAAASDRFLLGIAKYGRAGTEMRPMGRVPSSLANLTDQDLLDVVAHLRSLGDSQVVRQTVRGSVEAGHEWYHRVCAGCHGAQGRGGIGPALANPAFLAAAGDGFVQATMALGRSGTEMRAMTPHAGGVVELGRRDINDIIAYLRDESARWGSAAGTVQTAYGDVQQGRALFGSICAHCHGGDGRGTVAAPGLHDKTFLGYASDGFLQATMVRGRMGTGMRDFGLHGSGIASLTPRQITDIATFIRSWSQPQIAGAGAAPSSTHRSK